MKFVMKKGMGGKLPLKKGAVAKAKANAVENPQAIDDKYRVITLKQGIYEENDRRAAELRERIKAEKRFFLNLMSSPGSGKTTLLKATIEALSPEMKIGVMEADIDSVVDTATIAETGARAIQLHTGGMCHLDAEMTRQGIDALGTEDLDMIILENIGNLICTAAFDTGATKSVMILSVPEGDDKPLKYPPMFQKVDLVLVSKMDVAPYFNFDLERLKGHVARLNPGAQVLPLSALKGEGMEPWLDWLREQVKNAKA